MREVAIIGAGQTPVAEHWDKSMAQLAGLAVRSAMQDAEVERVDALFVGNMMAEAVNRQQNLGAQVAAVSGLRGVEATRLDAACGSGASAFRAGINAVASGAAEVVAVVGVEKMTDAVGDEVTAALAAASDADFEASIGLSFVAINALLMQRYMTAYGWRRADFAPFAINAHANACHNPFARLRHPVTEHDYLTARMVSEPINLLDASPTGDGAAVAVLVPADAARRRRGGRPGVTVAASAAATDTIALHDREDPLELRGARCCAQIAYAQAGVGPQDIDLFELHDAFSVMAALSLEAAGFAGPGQAPRLGLDGQIGPAGAVPIATLGGLKARGHPVGATGMYQILEVYRQLIGEAGATQVPGARIGMAQNIGGSGSSMVTHILRRN